MSQSCTYTFKGPDGRKMTIEGASALKAYLATGGLEFLLGEARADLARRPEQVLASQGREGDWSRLPGTHATKAAAEATVKVKVNGAKGTKPNPAWREYEFRIGQGRDDQWYVDARKRPGAASMKLSDKISYEGVTRSANRQIDTPEFKTWSGGNPVVLAAEAPKHQFETGKPVVVEGFHGTRRNFDRVDTAQASAGYFLTSKPLVADEYAGVLPDGMGGGAFPLGGNVQRQYVRMDNPLVVNARGASFNRVDTRGVPGYPLPMSNTDAINQWAKSQGYDGVVYKDLRDSLSRPDGRNAPPSNVYVTFKPSFVKSAIGNSGEYALEEESFLASRDRVTATPEFKKWFGDSKVVDAQGKPLVVYHGTNKDFSAFDPERVGGNFGVDEEGFFFTDSRVRASGYADPATEFAAAGMGFDRRTEPRQGSNVMPVYLSIQNPLTIEAYTDAFYTNPSIEIDEQGISLTDYFDDNRRSIMEFVKRGGHDGVLFQHKGKTLAVALRPEQIKSAIGNSGAFDPTNPNITKSAQRELPRGYVGPVSEEEREQGRLVVRLEGEAYKAWADGRDRARDEIAREIADGASNRDGASRIDDSIVAEVALNTALQRVAPGEKYDPEKHPFFSQYRELSRKVEAARVDLRKMVDARVGPPEFDSMRQLADFDRRQVRTPEFRRWFRDSKVTDGQDRPLIVFHGTNKDLSEFATVRESGAVRNNNWFGQLGSWFAAPQPGVEGYEPGSAEFTAEAFSELRGDEGSAVYPVYLSIQNPYEVEGYESLTEERDDAGGAAAFRQMLVKQGYDGVVVRESDTDGGQIRDDWVAFYPTQIKSAIGNRGTFSLDDPDITRSSGRDVKPLSIEQDSREWAVDGEPTITLNNARFGGGSVVQWVDGDKENYITSIAAYGDVRGHEMLRWLKEHTGKPSFAVDAVDDAIGFYERMGELGLVSGYTQDMVESFFGIDFGDGEPRRYAGDVRFDRSAARRSAERSPLGFYSALAKGIEDLPTKQAPAGAWKAAIKGLVNKGAAKADEVEWSGINDWLDLRQGKVTKEQVSEYLKQGGVRVEETELGGGRAVADSATGRTILLRPRTKYSQYTLPGGENYREVLLTLPEQSAIDEHRSFLARIRLKYPGTIAERNAAMSSEERAQLEALAARAQAQKDAPIYRSTHWDQPNVLAHIRMNDRTDADGKRVLLVEEIQSDFGQDFKKQRAAIARAVDSDFNGIVERMKKAGVLEVVCD